MQGLHPHIQRIVQLCRIHDMPLTLIEFEIQCCAYRHPVFLLCIPTDGTECTPERIIGYFFPEVSVFVINILTAGCRSNLLCQLSCYRLPQRLGKQLSIRAGYKDSYNSF